MSLEDLEEYYKGLTEDERKEFALQSFKDLSEILKKDETNFEVDAVRKGACEVLVSEIIEKNLNDEELEKEIDYLEEKFGDLFHDLYIESIFDRAKKDNK